MEEEHSIFNILTEGDFQVQSMVQDNTQVFGYCIVLYCNLL